MDIYNRSAERAIIEMNLSCITIIITESFQTVFNPDMLSMLGNIFPCLAFHRTGSQHRPQYIVRIIRPHDYNRNTGQHPQKNSTPIAFILSKELDKLPWSSGTFCSLLDRCQRSREIAHTHKLQDVKTGYHSRLQKRHDDLEKQADRTCAINNCCLVQFHRNRNRQSCGW